MDESLIKEWASSNSSYKQIAAEFAGKIASGQLTQWAEFPDNEHTARKHDVSVRTVIRAKRLLLKHGAAQKIGDVYVVA